MFRSGVTLLLNPHIIPYHTAQAELNNYIIHHCFLGIAFNRFRGSGVLVKGPLVDRHLVTVICSQSTDNSPLVTVNLKVKSS